MTGAEGARTVVRDDNRARRGDDDRSGSRHDNRSGHDWGGRDNDWRRLRHNNGLRDNWRGLRYDDRSWLCHDWGGLRHNDGSSRLSHDRSRLCDNRGLGYNGRLRDNSGLGIDNDSRWRLDGFRDIGDGVHDVEHRVEAAVVEGATMMVMGLSLDGVARQQDGGDGQTEDGVACVFHGDLLFVGWFVY